MTTSSAQPTGTAAKPASEPFYKRHGSRNFWLGIAALGVVFGDIGTSPLYVLRAVFTVHNGAVALNEANIYGVVSLLTWLLVLIVATKYVSLVLRADNNGEGGIIAMSTLLRSAVVHRPKPAILLTYVGMLGAALFFGDCVITPAISVLSAIEGSFVAFPDLPRGVLVPAALSILVALFTAQRYGTSKVGRVFGPLMALWFALLAAIGIPHILTTPAILAALSPHYAALFLIHNPVVGVIALGAVILAVTGAEALYADIAHFGRKPISAVWFMAVMPALITNYLGQGASLLNNPANLKDPFFTLVPANFTLVLTIIATIATVIASQAVIAGAYSVARQASRLGFLPHLTVRHTSAQESGQIYLPAINTLLLLAVSVVVIIFQDSEKLSSAYGLAVSMDFLLTTCMLIAVTAIVWRWKPIFTAIMALAFLVIEIPLFLANCTKILTGGWLPLLIAAVLMVIMSTWYRGEELVTAKRLKNEGQLSDFISSLEKRPPRRIPGTLIYPHSMVSTPPFALKANVAINRCLHDHVVVLSIKTAAAAHVAPAQRFKMQRLSNTISGIVHLTITYGFMDDRHINEDIKYAQKQFGLESWKLSEALWILSHVDVRSSEKPTMSRIRTKLFVGIALVSVSPAWQRFIPRSRKLEMSRTIAI
ncbi:potassium transporter Kup [Corynebacterium caspium]|uniref:potassium transporter Kup n=1 Tax=Corynebacterium caspium TaxID=234828 RepID=UPI000365F0CA|nr:KUP/HAK/KT family potassium transporter [Corynebacterium caspium]